MFITAAPLHATEPAVPEYKRAENYSEETVSLNATFKMGEQFDIHKVFPVLPKRFHYDDEAPALTGEIVIELDIDLSPGWNETMQFSEAEIHNGYCVSEGNASLTAFHFDTVMVDGYMYYSKKTTYNLIFTVKDRLVLPGMKDGTQPDLSLLKDTFINLYDNIENKIGFYYVSDCNVSSHWDSGLQKTVYDDFNISWNYCGTPGISSSNPEVVYVQPDYSLSGFMPGLSVITVSCPAWEGRYQETSTTYAVTVCGTSVKGDISYEVQRHSLKVSNEYWWDAPLVLADRAGNEQYPWDGLKADSLVINDYISYIGRDVFAGMKDIQTIRFRSTEHHLDSMHFHAFADTIRPWMFSMGDPQNGPLVPPEIVGGYTEEDIDKMKAQFGENTVLYVPDSVAEDIYGDKFRCIDLYKEDPLWGSVFSLVTDRTMDTAFLGGDAVLLEWLPLENAEKYLLTIREEGGEVRDTTVTIAARGEKGVVDWERTDLPQYLASRRTPEDEDGDGGLVIVIVIKSGSGNTHKSNVSVKVEGLKANTDYTVTREVVRNGGIADGPLTKQASFRIEGGQMTTGCIQANTAAAGVSGTRIYDILGRTVGDRVETLPDGLYIVDDGTQRTTILIRR